MKRIFLIVLFSTTLLTSIALAGIVEDTRSDCQSKLSSVSEQSQRIDMWYASNGGKDISFGQLAYLKSHVDEYITRVNDSIECGRKYKNYLLESLNDPRTITSNVVDTIKMIEQNEDRLNSNKEITLKNYEITNANLKIQIDREIVIMAQEKTQKMHEQIEKYFNDTLEKVTCTSGQKYDKDQQKCVSIYSSPGFESIYLLLLFTIVFLLRKI
jgi:hypothetical protein